MDGASGLSSGYCRLPPPSPLPLLSLLLLFLVSPSPFPSCAVRISSWVSWLLIPFPGPPVACLLFLCLEIFIFFWTFSHPFFLYLWISHSLLARDPHFLPH